jgi:hypothetical protein
MSAAPIVDASLPSRELVRTLRAGYARYEESLPESQAWQTWIELHKRGEPEASRLFIVALRTLHTRRQMAGSSLPMLDIHTDEHRLVSDSMLGELWKAYKKCIRNNRTGPAGEILKEIEQRID